MPETAYEFRPKYVPREALNQSTYWYDRTGKRYLIAEMNRQHKINAASKLIDYFGAKRALSCKLMAALIQN